MREWTFKSSSSSKIYRTVLNDDDHLSCDCPGWCVKKPGKPRTCKHTDKVVAQLGVPTAVRGDYVFVVPGSVAQATSAMRKAAAPMPAAPAPSAGPLAWAYRSPMLAQGVETGLSMDAFANGQYVAEEKFDGHRAVVAVWEGSVVAWSRPRAGESRGKVKELPPHVLEAMLRFPDGIYDGELMVPGGKSSDVGALEMKGLHRLVLFDVIRFGQQELDRVQLAGRRGILEAAYAAYVEGFPVMKSAAKAKRQDEAQKRVWLSPQFEPSQQALEQIWARGGEGLVLKRIDSLYECGGRSGVWLKKKKAERATFVLTGFKPGKNSPCGIVCLRDDTGIETTVKTKNNADVARFEANPNSFIGRGVVIEFQERHERTNVPRHPMWDRFVDE